MVKEKGGWWFIVGAGDFYGYPFPTRRDAEEVLAEIKRHNRPDAIRDGNATFDFMRDHIGSLQATDDVTVSPLSESEGGEAPLSSSEGGEAPLSERTQT